MQCVVDQVALTQNEDGSFIFMSALGRPPGTPFAYAGVAVDGTRNLVYFAWEHGDEVGTVLRRPHSPAELRRLRDRAYAHVARQRPRVVAA